MPTADYRIDGVDRQTGESRTVTVQAEDERDAVKEANKLGVMPTSTKRLKSHTPRRVATHSTESQVRRQRREFKVELVQESALGTIFLGESKVPAKKMESVLNRYGNHGWDVSFMVVEHRRLFLFWSRETVVITFCRPAGD